jgi:hypothetical protein
MHVQYSNRLSDTLKNIGAHDCAELLSPIMKQSGSPAVRRPPGLSCERGSAQMGVLPMYVSERKQFHAAIPGGLVVTALAVHAQFL